MANIVKSWKFSNAMPFSEAKWHVSMRAPNINCKTLIKRLFILPVAQFVHWLALVDRQLGRASSIHSVRIWLATTTIFTCFFSILSVAHSFSFSLYPFLHPIPYWNFRQNAISLKSSWNLLWNSLTDEVDPEWMLRSVGNGHGLRLAASNRRMWLASNIPFDGSRVTQKTIDKIAFVFKMQNSDTFIVGRY